VPFGMGVDLPARRPDLHENLRATAARTLRTEFSGNGGSSAGWAGLPQLGRSVLLKCPV